MLYLAEDRAYIESTKATKLRSTAATLSKGIAKLAAYLRKK